MGEYLLVAIFYIDDLIILTSNAIQLKWLISKLKKKIEMSDLIELYYCLRVDFERNKEASTITMNQRSYIEEVLKRFSMENCKPIGTLFDVNSKVLKLSNEEFENVQKKK